eukprot:352856-Chlamydomonas_euryale.AAC.9
MHVNVCQFLLRCVLSKLRCLVPRLPTPLACRVAGLNAAGRLKTGPERPANARSKPGLVRRRVT